MNLLKGSALLACIQLSVLLATGASLGSVAAAATDKKPTKAQLDAFLAKCSAEADAKKLFVKAGKGEARKEYRRECMRKLGVEPKAK